MHVQSDRTGVFVWVQLPNDHPSLQPLLRDQTVIIVLAFLILSIIMMRLINQKTLMILTSIGVIGMAVIMLFIRIEHFEDQKIIDRSHSPLLHVTVITMLWMSIKNPNMAWESYKGGIWWFYHLWALCGWVVSSQICNTHASHAWTNFTTELKEIEALQQRFYIFRILYIENNNDIVDSLAMTARVFHKELYFVGSILG